MTISQGQFAGYFSRNIVCIDSTGQIHLYMDRPNQTPIFYVMVGGKVKHRGKRKHAVAMYNRLARKAARVATA